MTDFEDIRLRDLRLLERLASCTSLTAAARSLGVPKATASRWLAALEDRVGRRLVERNTRHLTLTDQGRVFLEHARAILRSAEQAHQAVTTDAPAGRIRVSMPVPMGRMLAGAAAADFRRRMPGVRLELHLDNARVELVRDGFDVAVRGGPLPDSDLIARKLARVPLLLYGPPGLRGAPLERVPFVAAPGDDALLRRARGLRLDPVVLVDDRLAIADAVRAGAGMGLLPGFVGEPDVRDGALVHLDDAPVAAFPVHALFVAATRRDVRVAAFVEVLAERLRSTVAGRAG